MVVCKFFLQGTCKFGDMCKFEHDLNDGFNNYQNSNGTSILHNTSFGATPITQPKINLGQEKSKVDTATLVKSVVSDMTQADKGGQWLFSCYAPFKEKPAFPGFEDQSFEEVRFGYYEASKAGTVEQFKQQIQGMAQQVLMKVRSLENPSPDIVNVLVSIYNTAPSLQAGVFSGNTFSNTNISNFSFKSAAISQQPIFAQANQNIFGNNQQPQQQQSVFNNSSGNSIFGGGTIQPAQNNIFNNNNAFQNTQSQVQTSTNNLFIQPNNNLGVQNNNPVFSNQQPSVPIFANNQQPTSTNIFAQQAQPNNIFQPVSQAPNNAFAVPNVQNSQTSVTSPSTMVFAFPMQNTQTQSQQTPLFTQPPQAPHSKALLPTPKNETPQLQAYSNSIFGNAPAANSPFTRNVQSAQYDDSYYSKLEDLTEEEINWFESDDLDVTKIPEKPPTYEMCFK